MEKENERGVNPPLDGLDRRTFLRRSAIVTGALAATHLARIPAFATTTSRGFSDCHYPLREDSGLCR